MVLAKELKVLVVAPRNVLLRGLFGQAGFRLIQHPAKILIRRVRASMAGNAHLRFEYILHKQMPKPSRLERDRHGRLHVISEVPHGKGE
jgi:hypothetical protein